MNYQYIDLFAGCGGLSLGIEASGGELILAVEKSSMAAETFAFNLRDAELSVDWKKYLTETIAAQIDQGLLVSPVSALLGQPEALGNLRRHGIDAVVGGPPCQGFSLAGRRDQSDERNKLPWEFLEVVDAVNPKIVVIENVVGMRHKFRTGDHSPFDALAIALSETGEGYKVQKAHVNALHYGAAQSRPRLLLVGVRNDLAKRANIHFSDGLWESKFADNLLPPIPDAVPVPNVKEGSEATVRDALSDLIGQGKSAFLKHLNQMFSFLPSRTNLENLELRTHSESTKTRFALYHLVEKHSLPFGLINFNAPAISDAAALLRFADLRFPISNQSGTILAKGPEELLALFKEFRTFKQSQRIVLLDRPSPTILTSADDYIHPVEERVFSVRELARMQGFPDDFVFRSKATTGGLNRRHEVPQYSQVGNAVSPFLSLAIGKMIRSLLESDV